MCRQNGGFIRAKLTRPRIFCYKNNVRKIQNGGIIRAKSGLIPSLEYDTSPSTHSISTNSMVKNHVSCAITRFIYLILMKLVFKVLLRTSRNGFIYSTIAYRLATTPKFERLKEIIRVMYLFSLLTLHVSPTVFSISSYANQYSIIPIFVHNNHGVSSNWRITFSRIIVSGLLEINKHEFMNRTTYETFCVYFLFTFLEYCTV